MFLREAMRARLREHVTRQLEIKQVLSASMGNKEAEAALRQAYRTLEELDA